MRRHSGRVNRNCRLPFHSRSLDQSPRNTARLCRGKRTETRPPRAASGEEQSGHTPPGSRRHLHQRMKRSNRQAHVWSSVRREAHIVSNPLRQAQRRQVEVVKLVEDDSADLAAIVSLFTARLYRQRRAKRKTERIAAEVQATGDELCN
jgi:hypothetical protein